jgi:hypothetical protein
VRKKEAASPKNLRICERCRGIGKDESGPVALGAATIQVMKIQLEEQSALKKGIL